MAPVREGHADFRGWQTWYRVTGALGGEKLPLVVLHGGPGCTHDYVDSIKGLAASGRAIIHYDQLGNGGSTHLRDQGVDFWTRACFSMSSKTSSAISEYPRPITCWASLGAGCWAPNMR
jgi:L-proline amide hydrolase